MRTHLVIITCFLIGLAANLPPVITVGNFTFVRPAVDLSLFGRRLYRDFNFRLGLDLQGGTHLVYAADTSGIPEPDRSAAVLSTKENIDRRIDYLGVAEARSQISNSGGDYRLIVELPGIRDVSSAVALIGQTAVLDFRLPAVATPSSAADFISTGLTGRDLKIAKVEFNTGQAGGSPGVALEFNSAGAEKLAAITSANLGSPMAIFLDDRLLSQPPVIQSVIPDGKAVISGNFSLEEAKQLTIQLNAGALPVPVRIVEQRSIGATLGLESVIRGLFAGLVGFFMVLLFMIANYGRKGILADVALIIYILLSLTLFKLIPVTLTLAGIAGFVLSVGMAVDANILIFERIKEETRWGRPRRAAIELGFHRAWNSVRDSNASSLITAAILFWFGTGPVRGFALTLAVGILVSLFTSVVVTRSLIRTFAVHV